MKRTFLSIIFAVTMVVISVNPASAASVNSQDGQLYVFYGNTVTKPDGTIDLNASQISKKQKITGQSFDLTKDPQNSMMAAAVPKDKEILYRWDEWRKWGIVVRRTAGEKIGPLHNVSIKAVKATTLWPATTERDPKADGTTWIYQSPVDLVKCSTPITCKSVERRTVRVVHNYRKLDYLDKESMGLITAYCVDYAKCPDWVNEAAERSISKI
ncbi:hypothetical protein AB0B04_33005 [Streptomyces xinghaiensis]